MCFNTIAYIVNIVLSIMIAEFQYCNFVLSVPFEEEDKDPSIWFLDHNYHESMFSMFKRINGNTCFNFLLFVIAIYVILSFISIYVLSICILWQLFQPRNMS